MVAYKEHLQPRTVREDYLCSTGHTFYAGVDGREKPYD